VKESIGADEADGLPVGLSGIALAQLEQASASGG
jgi:hypothetical protein